MSVKDSAKNSRPENFEEILESIGGLGRFQILILMVLFSLEIPTAFIGFIPVFTGKHSQSWECEGLEIENTEACLCNGTLSAPKPYTSIVAEWNLVCDLAWISDFVNSLQMLGMMFGILFSSQIADWYGRKYVVFGATLLLGTGSIISAVAPNYYVYAAGRVICGAGYSSIHSVTGVYALEFMPIKWRSLCACVGLYGWGTMGLGLLAYLVRPWRTLAWISTSPLLLFSPLILLVPESPRFLFRQRKLEETQRVLNFMAKINGHTAIDSNILKEIASKEGKVQTAKASYLDLLRRKELRQVTVCLCSIWFAWGLVYFGIYFNIKNVPGNLYLSVFYMGLADAIGFPSTLLILNRLGRRTSVVLAMSLGATFLVVLAALQLALDLRSYPVIILVLCTISKYFMAVTRCAAKCFTAESYPTDVRGIGAGLCGVVLALGALICPQVVYIGTFVPAVPFFVFAIIGVSGSFCSFFVVETTGKPLQESIARKLSRRISIISSILFPTTNKDEAI